jgi:hypothetical protein
MCDFGDVDGVNGVNGVNRRSGSGKFTCIYLCCSVNTVSFLLLIILAVDVLDSLGFGDFGVLVLIDRFSSCNFWTGSRFRCFSSWSRCPSAVNTLGGLVIVVSRLALLQSVFFLVLRNRRLIVLHDFVVLHLACCCGKGVLLPLAVVVIIVVFFLYAFFLF